MLKQKYIRPYEKRIAELEKENAELLAKNKWYSEQVCNKECSEVWGQVEILQKENTELKENWRKDHDTMAEHNLGLIDLYAQAKKIIKNLLVHSKRYVWIADKDHKAEMHKDIEQAEQFLKE